MKRFLAFLFITLIITAATMQAKGESTMHNIIPDPGFDHGAWVYAPPKPMTLSGKIQLSESAERPLWLLTQWNSRNNIIRTPVNIENGAYVYKNTFKTVQRDADGTLTLRVNAGEEYTRIRTAKTDTWVHLYFEHRYKEPIPIGESQAARLSLDFSIPFFVNVIPPSQYDVTLHAAIAVFYIILKDTNPTSVSYGQYINFCVMLYDNRTGVTAEALFVDSGQAPQDATNMMIYTMPSSAYVGPVYADGAWHCIDFDILPYFRRALDLTQQQGYMPGTVFEDLSVSSVFFGFEVPGNMNVEMKIKNPCLVLE